MLCLALAAKALQDPQPTAAPPGDPPPGAAKAFIKEGIRKHDAGDFGGAIVLYRQALEVEPANVDALYEIAYSYYAMKDFSKSLEYATRAAEQPSPLKPALLNLIGNVHDDLHEPARAIDAYTEALKLSPKLPLLHYNIGIAYVRLHDLNKARASFQQAIEVNPAHASSHFWLGKVYAEQGYRVPAILAFGRFLVLEPASRRSAEALKALDGIYQAGVKSDGKGNTQITIDPDANKDEGDFLDLEVVVSMSQVTPDTDAGSRGAPPRPLEVSRLDSVLTAAGELAGQTTGTGFAVRHYLPYYAGMANQKLGEAFAFYDVQSSGDAAVAQWLKVNRHAVERMLQWSAAFRWTSPAMDVTPPASSPSP